jgi:hypothetical protein
VHLIRRLSFMLLFLPFSFCAILYDAFKLHKDVS